MEKALKLGNLILAVAETIATILIVGKENKGPNQSGKTTNR